MHWLLFLLAVAALVVAFTTTSLGVLLACLLVAFGLALAGVLQLLARRLDDRSRAAGPILDPVELHRMREQAEARKLAAHQADRNAG